MLMVYTAIRLILYLICILKTFQYHMKQLLYHTYI